MQFDVAVLGGGVAGTAAALAATQQNARTCVVAGPPGSTALFSGAWLGECPEDLARALAGVGYELRTCEGALPHCHGHLISCAAAPPPQHAARPSDGSVVVGIAGLPVFNARILAARWSAQSGVEMVGENLVLDVTPRAGWSAVSLASQIERTPELIIEPLRRVVRTHAARCTVLPAILGLRHDHATSNAISTALGTAVGEALAVPPSLPGWRLHHALRSALAAAGVAVLEGKALASGRRNGRVHQIELLNGDVIAARSFVLATGKYASGGIEVDTAFREPAFGCPVWIEHLGERFETVDSLMLTDPVRAEDQPILRAGVHTDDEHRPVSALHDVVYSNVLVAGSIRAGWTSGTHTIGDAACDGWAAGLKAVHA